MTQNAAAVSDLPLVVDLDGTLIASDVLHELATRFLVARPHGALHLLRWAAAGPTRLKSELVKGTALDVTALPYREDLLVWLREQKAAGRTLVLASATHETVVQAIADRLGIFDEAIGSTEDVNLRSAAKAAALVDRFGERGFEYVGNHKHDVEVWGAAASAHVVTGSDSLVRLASAQAPIGRRFEPEHSSARAIWKALRPHQWVKNVLVLLPLFTAHLLGDAEAVRHALQAFVSFCLVASSVYILNDLADLDNDRHHPTKRRRPFASGAASLRTGWLLWPALALAGFLIAVPGMPWQFVVVLASYLATTLAYTFWLKRKPVADVVALGALYTVRVIAGVAAIDVPVSSWLLTFSLFFFLSLALIKRVSELTRARSEGTAAKGRGYVDSDLELVSSYGVSSSIAAAVIFALYVHDPETTRLYDSPEILWGALPILLTWLMRSWLVAHRGRMNEDPIVWAVSDRASLVLGAMIGVVFVVAKVVTL